MQSSQPDQYNAHMLRSVEMGWFVLDKYYSKTDQAPVYAAALLLDPRKRAAYIRKNWPSDWHESSTIAATMIWEENYNTDLSGDLLPNLEFSPPPPEERLNKLDMLLKELDVKPTSQAESDDFNTFINADPIKLQNDCTPLQWWCQSDQRRQYPRLSRMAIAVLSIPAESSEPERTFSGARRTCSWDRLRLSCGTVEMIECIGNWLREGHIRPLYLNGMGLPIEPEAQDDLDGIDDESIDMIEWL